MAAYDILTASEVKDYLGITGSAKDTIIGTFISDVSLWIEEYLGRKVAGSQSVSAEIGNGDGSDRFYPKYPPVTAVSALQKRGSPTDSFADICSNASNILIDPINGDFVEVYGTYFPAGRNNIKITYTAGYSTVPNPIKQVAYEMVAVRFRESTDAALGENRLGVSSVSRSDAGGGTTSRSFEDLMPKWEKVLNRYKRPYPQSDMMR